jgi:transcription antitermination factor NusB
MGRRRTARELAIQLAYWMDLKGLRPDQAAGAMKRLPLLDDETAFPGEPEDDPPDLHSTGAPEGYFTEADWEKARFFAVWLVQGTWEKMEEVDAAIARLTEHWRPERMPTVDRNILRLACFEMLFATDIPPKASINEWIEVAKKFSTENSGAFVNGILDRLYRERGR